MTKPLILGLTASLRNARSRAGSRRLADELAGIHSEPELDAYLCDQANICLDQYMSAGRAAGKPFDELYRDLRRMGGLNGLSNSEVCLVAAMWEVREGGCDIAHIPLPDHFPADGSEVAIDELKSALRRADGFLLATPVYFGDRSSLAQRFIEMIRSDDQLREDLAGKIYAGIAVGAKRNGGQETTLIYQMLDFLNTGLLAVGNDSDTTSQYGGTAHAGDIGTGHKDTYGLNTSKGTGRRIAQVAHQLNASADYELVDRPRIGMWTLQDRNGELGQHLAPFIGERETAVDLTSLNMLSAPIRPCLACDTCPTHVAPDKEYRCIIHRRDDGMVNHHQDFLGVDVLVPAVLSPANRDGLESVYQTFMERTRYLRRGDYVFTDHLVVPLVVSDVDMHEHMDIRMMTSFIRHHTVMHKPFVAWVHNGRIVNEDEVRADFRSVVAHAQTLVAGRLGVATTRAESAQYNPVGYVLAPVKDREQATMDARQKAVAVRRENIERESGQRLRAKSRKIA